ncbi:hypothetical protein NC651_013630 [Populus alba x Populus x berolinensis]|nr:hypothetical protein NC651_013630 [Populus alba x Populus x berolinensis]
MVSFVVLPASIIAILLSSLKSMSATKQHPPCQPLQRICKERTVHGG